MATSPYLGRIDFDPSRHGAQEGVDAFQSLVYANNLAHGCDSSFQVLTNWMTGTANAPNVAPPDASFVALHRSGPVAVRLAPDRSLTLRYRLRGFVSAGTTTFALAVHDPSVAPGTDATVVARQSVATGTTSATSDGWFLEGVMSIAAGQLVTKARPTLDVAGGSPATTRFHEVAVSVLANNTGADTATLTGLYVAGYIGL